MKGQQQALLAAILSTAVDAIIVIDEVGKIDLVNESATRMFGFSEQEMVGQNIRMLMPEPDRGQHDGYLKNYHQTGIKKIIGVGREVTGKRKDNSTFPMHLAVSEVPLGKRKLFAGIIRDITNLVETKNRLASINEDLEQRVEDRTKQLHRAQEELVRAEKLATLGQVSGGIAHEIRNPLSVIQTSVFYLRRAKNPSPAKIEQHLDRIERQVALIDNVVTALSDVARLPEPKVCQCDIVQVVNEVCGALSLPASIELKRQLKGNTPKVKIDPNQVSIVFRNLLRNARDAMDEGGLIEITSDANDGFVMIRIADTGSGIAEDDLSRITEPLFSTKARGMGLGLAICAAILDKNGGRLTVQSEIDKGTEFTVHLPRHPVSP